METRVKNRIIIFLLFIIQQAAFPLGTGEQEEGDFSDIESMNNEIDYLSIAAVMIRDGRYAKAESLLEKVNPDTPGIDMGLYFTVRGLVFLNKSLFTEALSDFKSAFSHGRQHPVINAYMAQAYYGLEDYRNALLSIEKTGNINMYPDLVGMRIQCHWNLKERIAAFETLGRAITLFPSNNRFHLQRISFLLELNLTREAAFQAKKYLVQFGDKSEAYMTIGEALRRGGETDSAIRVLETAKLKFAEDSRIGLALAGIYLRENRFQTAAKLVEEVAIYDREFYPEAAELYRRAGDFDRALYLNRYISDQRLKAEQRFTLFLETGKFEEALALEERLQRLGLLDDNRMRYAVAYAFFQIQLYDKALSCLSAITDEDYFTEAVKLRKAIEILKSKSVQLF
ncbi:MAG: hypothetical protein JW881_02405 [Spirochaetales bacterium]|nr:hypothetical protein [Spirochaetales bacterium]